MSTVISFWRKEKVSLKEIKIILSLRFVNIFTFLEWQDKHGNSKYNLDIIYEAQEDIDKVFKKIDPRDVLYEGQFSTVRNPLPSRLIWEIEINQKIKSPDSEPPKGMSIEQYHKEFLDKPEKWWSSPDEIKHILKDWKPKTWEDKQCYEFYKTLSDLGFYCAIGE